MSKIEIPNNNHFLIPLNYRRSDPTLVAHLSVIHIKSALLEASSFRISGRGSGSAGTSAILSRGQKRYSRDPDSSLSRSTHGGDAPNSENETVLSSWADRGP